MARSVPPRTRRQAIRCIVPLAGTGAEAAGPEGNDTLGGCLEDPFPEVLEAGPLDDEPFSPEDRPATDRGWNEYLRAEPSPLDEVRQRRLVGSETDRGRRTVDQGVSLPR